jgi:hypothetical protein
MFNFFIKYRVYAFLIWFIFLLQAQNYKLEFSAQRGFYQEPFNLTINSLSGESIQYTIDGSDPRFSETAQVSSSPLTIVINPENTAGRYIAPGFVVRACIVADTVPPQYVYTRT